MLGELYSVMSVVIRRRGKGGRKMRVKHSAFWLTNVEVGGGGRKIRGISLLWRSLEGLLCGVVVFCGGLGAVG